MWQNIKDFIISLVQKYLKPFWFSRHYNHIMVPYVYNWLIMLVFIGLIILFGVMAYGKWESSILMATSAVIATLAGLYVGIIAMYEKSKNKREDENE
jgi:archaellum biogenesis protein FlaJ (TadC family)